MTRKHPYVLEIGGAVGSDGHRWFRTESAAIRAARKDVAENGWGRSHVVYHVRDSGSSTDARQWVEVWHYDRDSRRERIPLEKLYGNPLRERE